MGQLANIAGPVEFAEFAERFCIGLPNFTTILLGKLLSKVLDELRDVFHTITQRWDLQFDHVQSEVKIFSESTFDDFIF